MTLGGAGSTTPVQVSNVKAGDLSATSTDAVNGSQLYATNQNVATNATNIANNSTNITNLQNQTFKLQANGDVASAVKSSDTVQFLNGENINITRNGNDITVATAKAVAFDKVTVGNVVVDKTTNKITGIEAGTDTNDAVNKGQLDAVIADQAAADALNVKYDSTTKDKVTLGGAGSTTPVQVSNVKAGDLSATSTDAINGSQLYNTANNVKNLIGGTTTIDANTGVITTSNIGGTGKNTIDDAIKNVSTAATKAKTEVEAGKNITVTSTIGKDGQSIYTVATANEVSFDKLTVGPITVSNAGIDAGNKQVTNVAAGTNATDAVNKGQLDSAINNVNNNVNQLANNAVKYDDATKDKITLGGANGTTISNVKDGTVAQSSKEAVNGGQLWNVQQQVNQNTSDIENIQTNINNINNGKSGLVQQQTPNGDITIGKDTGGTKVSVAGKDGDRVVTGVKDGVISATSKDAVNGSQLNVTNNKVVEFLGGGAGYDNITNSFTNPTYTVGGKEYNNVGGAVDALNKADQALDSKIDNVSNRLEQAFYSTNQRIDDVEKRANAGIAAAMALENAPYIPGKYTYAVGAAYHGGENAIGLTLRKTADNGRWSITGGVAAASQGDPSVRIGISGVIH